MKRFIPLLIFVSFVGTAFVSDTGGTYTPVFMSREALERSVAYRPEGREMKQVGKIYYRAPYIYVNERYKGIHVVNNTDPAHPVNEGFIVAPGCIDMAVKGSILYLDNSVDLVSFDLDSKSVTKRIRNVFPEPLPPEDFWRNIYAKHPEGYILVEWKRK